MLFNLLIIGAGGFAGSILRYLAQVYLYKVFATAFPLGTMTVNVIGSFLIGVFYGLFDRGALLSPELRIFLTVGLCGGFTTFSAFSYEVLTLLRSGQFLYASVYILLSVILSIIAVITAYIIVKNW